MDTSKPYALPKERIEACFDGKEDQGQVWDALYRAVYPDWDAIEHIDGYPLVSENTHGYIFKRFVEFDKAHHPDCFAGGLWMNSGFGYDRSLKDWYVVPAPAAYRLELQSQAG